MRKPIPLRLDYDATRLRRIARDSEDGNQVRRLLALAKALAEAMLDNAVLKDITSRKW